MAKTPDRRAETAGLYLHEGGVLRVVGLCMVLLLGVGSVQSRDLTLEQALAVAEAQSTTLQKLDAGLSLAKARHLRSAQAFLPKVSMDATWFRADATLLEDVPFPSLRPQPRLAYRDLGPLEGAMGGVQILQPLLHVSGLQARRQADHIVAAQQQSHTWGRLQMRFEVVRLYYAVTVQEEHERAAEDALAAAQQAHQMAKAAYQEGLVPKLDVMRALAELEASRARRTSAAADVQAARIALATLLGLSPQERQVLVDAFPEPIPPLEQPLSSMGRSDLGAQEERQKAAAAGLDKAQARWVPKVVLLGRQQWIDGEDALTSDADSWLVALQLQWSWFDGLDREGEIREARAEYRLAQTALDAAQRRVQEEQLLAASTWRSAWSAWQAAVGARDAAGEALRLAQRQYEENLVSMTDLLATQATFYAQQRAYTCKRYNVLLASMNYYLRYGMDPLTALPGETP